MLRVTFTGKEIGQQVLADRCSCHAKDGTIGYMSIIAHGKTIKQIGSIMNSNRIVEIRVEDSEGGTARFRTSLDTDFIIPTYGLKRSELGYERYAYAIGYDKFHAAFVSKAVGFVSNVSEDGFWEEFKKPRWKTPMLRRWMRPVLREMEDREYIKLHHSFNVWCAEISATPEQLDDVVKHLVEIGKLDFTE